MPIRIRHRDMTTPSMQQCDISLVMSDAILVSQASYTAFEAVFGGVMRININNVRQIKRCTG